MSSTKLELKTYYLRKLTKDDVNDKYLSWIKDKEVTKYLDVHTDSRLHFHLRDTRSTIRSNSIVRTLEEIIIKFDPKFIGTTVLSYLQTPFVQTATLEESATTLSLSGADSVRAVEEIHAQVFRRTGLGLEPVNVGGNFTTDFDAVYRDALACIATRNKNIASGSLTGTNVVSYVISATECFFLGSEQHFNIAQLLSKDPPRNTDGLTKFQNN